MKLFQNLSIRTRIVLANTIIFGVVLLALAFVLCGSVKRSDTVRLNSQLTEFSAEVIHELSDDIVAGNTPDTSDLDDLRQEAPRGTQFRLFDGSGKTICVTLVGDSLFPQPASPASYLDTADGRVFRSYLSRFEPQKGKVFFLGVSAPLTDIEAHQAHLRLFFGLFIPLALLLTGFASWSIMRTSFRPMSQMIDMAGIISANNLDKRLPLPAARDDVWRMGTVFNAMLGRISAAFSSQKQFVADASHELRTPLAVIRGELEFAARQVHDPQSTSSIAIAQSEIDRLAALTDNLLMLARFDAGQVNLVISPITLNDLLSETIRLYETQASQKSISLDLTIPYPIKLMCDGEKIKRAVINLLDNAVKFCPVGSKVTVSAQLDSGGKVLISMSDSGPGISYQDQTRIFERFFRSDDARMPRQGYGLGLSIAEGLVALHGGKIRVQSDPGKGTTFLIELPCLILSEAGKS
jgi:signal transduction histidine kinase